MDNIMVSVFMLAYNHEKYIRDALDGVLMQKTDFRFEIIIHDDASTDGTAEIIREYAEKYPDIIIPIYQKENQFSKGIRPAYDIMPDFMKGKYIALCECDDYWIDENKLQKQVDFLEAYSDYSMTMHNAWQYDLRFNKKTLLDIFSHSGFYSLKYQVQTGLGTKFPATASYVFRAEYWRQIPREFIEGMVGDYPIRIFYASKGKVYYFEEPMSVYRYSLDGSFTQRISTDTNAYVRYIMEMHRLYQMLNQYLDYRFDDIYQRKIKSDYLGLAAAIQANEGKIRIKDALPKELTIDMALYQECADAIDPQKIEPGFVAFIRSHSRNYLYGTSKLAEQISNKLTCQGLSFDGFVVSDGYGKPAVFCEKKTYYLSEIAQKKKNAGIILSVQPINEAGISDNLKQYKFLDTYHLF